MRKGSAKEEYSLPLAREENPLAVRFSQGRNGEGSFETGFLKESKKSRFVSVI